MGLVNLDVKNGIGFIVINRPDKLNALGIEAFYELDKAIEEINTNKEIRVSIITGSGNKAFAVGGDINLLKELTPIKAVQFSRFVQQMFSKMEQSEKPYIACVNGYALGGGFELALF